VAWINYKGNTSILDNNTQI